MLSLYNGSALPTPSLEGRGSPSSVRLRRAAGTSLRVQFVGEAGVSQIAVVPTCEACFTFNIGHVYGQRWGDASLPAVRKMICHFELFPLLITCY